MKDFYSCYFNAFAGKKYIPKKNFESYFLSITMNADWS